MTDITSTALQNPPTVVPTFIISGVTIMRIFTTTDSRDFRTGDTIAWTVWDGTTATATITYAGRWSYSRVSGDGYSEALDHHWGCNRRLPYTVTRQAAAHSTEKESE